MAAAEAYPITGFRGLALCLALYPLATFAADGDRTIVHLQIKRGIDAWSGQPIDFGLASGEKVIAAPGSQRTGKAPRATITAEPVEGKPGAYHLVIRGATGEPVTAILTPAEPAHVEIPRGVVGVLPYKITLDANAGPNRSPLEAMFWTPEYRAEGTLTVGACKALLAVWDMTSDGEFTRRDFVHGSAVGIDLNGDGKLSGRQEYVTAGEIFEFCGKSFYVDPDSLESDGSAVTLVETSAARPTLDAPLPSFALITTDGGTIRSESWRGKLAVLDFWASWCGYCIEGFPILKEMQKTFAPALEIVSIDTDEPTGVAAARKVLSENDLPWPKVMSGKGLADPVWGMFQAMEARSLPLYVMVDRDGVIRYSGSGGERLAELRAAIEKLAGPNKR
jgi:thiol-disulfide isomerase/thioredoxin